MLEEDRSCYLLEVLLIMPSKLFMYDGTLTTTISSLLTTVSGAKSLFMYSNQGILENLRWSSAIVIGLYKAVALRRFSLGKEIYKNRLSLISTNFSSYWTIFIVPSAISREITTQMVFFSVKTFKCR